MADIQIQETKTVEGTTKFGIEGLKNPTPKWAIWTFRIEFALCKAVTFWLASTHRINIDNLQETLLIVTAIDSVVWTLARFVGVKKTDFED